MVDYKEQPNEQIVITVEKFIQRIAYTSSNMPEYIGIARPGAAADATVWQIKKMAYDANSNVTSVLYADGDLSFDNSWDLRATYTYS